MLYSEMLNKLIDFVDTSENIVFFGGAGVSTESNIPDFRSEKGIYQTVKEYGIPPEYILSRPFFMKNTEEFYRFHKDKMVHMDAKPNKAHNALARLEEMGKLKAVITQNIDGLHQMAGSKNVIELHGSIHRNNCMDCHAPYALEYIISHDGVPKCDTCGGTIKPDVVLYEEELDVGNINKAVSAIRNADVLIVGGTSLVVYPAAGMVEHYHGSKLVLINKSDTQYDEKANLVIHDSIGNVFYDLMRGLEQEHV